MHIRYILSPEGAPRRITEGRERQIAIEDLPQQVIREATAWLKSTVEAARSQHRDELAGILSAFLTKVEGSRT